MKDQQNTDSQDARRYRFLRDKAAFLSKTAKGGYVEVHYGATQNPDLGKFPDVQLDAAIDAAMEAALAKAESERRE